MLQAICLSDFRRYGIGTKVASVSHAGHILYQMFLAILQVVYHSECAHKGTGTIRVQIDGPSGNRLTPLFAWNVEQQRIL